MNRDSLQILYAYNAHANAFLLDTIQHMTAEEINREVSPSHGSVHRLLLHMLACETGFLSLCQGNSFRRLPEFDTLDDICSFWKNLERDYDRFLAQVEEEDLKKQVSLEIKGESSDFAVWQLLLQACLHSIHHRGELSVVLSQLGYPLPTLDIILHFAQQKDN